jgi:arsenical pump membrane protein
VAPEQLGPPRSPGHLGARLAPWGLAALGGCAAGVSVLADRSGAASAASQVWSPFILVAGLLLVGLAADRDGLFAATGHRLALMAPNGMALFAGAAVTVAVVTALLNLDTSVVFLTPVLAYAARSRGQGGEALLVGSLLLSNAGSLLLPGSNLTNLIVLGHLHLSGGRLFGRMVLPWMASVLITGAVIAVVERRSLRAVAAAADEPHTLRPGLGVWAVGAVTVLVLVLRAPAVPVAAVGVLVSAVRLASHREEPSRLRQVLGAPVLIALFGVAVALGTFGRAWSGPSNLLSHLDAVGTAAVAAAATVLVNNLPAAALLASRVPPHPYALLVGLDIGPNLFVTGSLAWILWVRTARATGSSPPVARTVLIGLASVPLSMAAALAMLAVTGPL